MLFVFKLKLTPWSEPYSIPVWSCPCCSRVCFEALPLLWQCVQVSKSSVRAVAALHVGQNKCLEKRKWTLKSAQTRNCLCPVCARAKQKRFTTVFTHPTAKWTHNNLQLIALVNFKQTLQFFLCGAMTRAFTLCQLEWNLNIWPLNSSVKVRVKVTIKASLRT